MLMCAALGLTTLGAASTSGRVTSSAARSFVAGNSISGREAHRGPGADSCKRIRHAVLYYTRVYRDLRARVGAGVARLPAHRLTSCPHYHLRIMRAKAIAARAAYERWYRYHYRWDLWLPDKWQRIGACETGYGRRPGDWRWNSGPYQGAFGFAVSSWDAFRLPGYPSEAYLATPRQQYEVALAIWRRYGLTGWGCRDA